MLGSECAMDLYSIKSDRIHGYSSNGNQEKAESSHFSTSISPRINSEHLVVGADFLTRRSR